MDRQAIEKTLGHGAAMPDAALALEATLPGTRRVAER
jgi:hypothetical protein